jgi:hypothetical protein
VRRMCEAVGHPVVRLRRVRIGPITDEHIRPGEFRDLSEREVAALKRAVSGAGRARTPTHPEAPGSTPTHPDAPRSTPKHPDAPRSTPKHPDAPRRTPKHPVTPRPAASPRIARDPRSPARRGPRRPRRG